MDFLVSLLTFLSVLSLTYIYLGYPLIIAVLASIRPKPIARGAYFPKVTMLISAYNEAPFVADKIKNTLAIDYPSDKLEIIFSSDGSDDGSEAIAAETGQGRVTVLHYPERRGKPSAINNGLAHATGDIILLSDARPLYQPDAVKRLMADFADPEVGLVNGTVLFRKLGATAISQSNNTYFSFEDWLKKQETACGSTMSVHGPIMAVRRELLEPLPKTIVNDDAYIGLKVLGRGKRVVYEPEAIAWGVAPAKIKGDMERRYRMTAGRFQLLFYPGLMPWHDRDVAWRYLSHKAARLFLPLFMITAFVPGALGYCLTDDQSFLVNLALLPQAAFYALALAGFFLARLGIESKVLDLPFFIVRSTFSSFVGFYRFIKKTQNVKWNRSTRESHESRG